MSAILELTAAAQAADPACSGCALLGARPADPGWLVADRADGLRVRIDGVGAESPAVPAVLALDLSAEAVAARELGRKRAEAVAAFLTSNEPVIVASRALFRIVFTWINDERESRGAARILEPDIIALAMGGTLNDGLGDAPVTPSEPQLEREGRDGHSEADAGEAPGDSRAGRGGARHAGRGAPPQVVRR